MSERQDLAYYELVGLGDVPEPAEPPPGIVIRAAAHTSDIPIIAELYNAAFDPVDGTVTPSEVEAYARHPGLGAAGVFLAFDGERAVGVVVSRLDVPAPGGATRRAGVELLAVRPECRRRGIGAALVGRLLAWLAKQGVETVGATVRVAGDAEGVVTLIERYGFRNVGEATRSK